MSTACCAGSPSGIAALRWRWPSAGALTVIYALVQGMTGGQLYAAAGDAVMQSLDGLAMRDSLLYTLHQMGLLSLPQAMRETALVAVEGGYAFSAEAAQELTLQCRTLVMSLLHGLLPALLVSGTATNVLTGMGLGIYFGRRAAQKRAFKRDEPEQDIPDLGMPELRYWHIPRPWGLRIGILAVGYLIMRLPVGDTLYLLGALMWQAFCVCFAVQGLAAINFNQHQRGTRKGWRVAAIIAAMTVSLFQSVLMIIGVFDQINNARGCALRSSRATGERSRNYEGYFAHGRQGHWQKRRYLQRKRRLCPQFSVSAQMGHGGQRQRHPRDRAQA